MQPRALDAHGVMAPIVRPQRTVPHAGAGRGHMRPPFPQNLDAAADARMPRGRARLHDQQHPFRRVPQPCRHAFRVLRRKLTQTERRRHQIRLRQLRRQHIAALPEDALPLRAQTLPQCNHAFFALHQHGAFRLAEHLPCRPIGAAAARAHVGQGAHFAAAGFLRHAQRRHQRGIGRRHPEGRIGRDLRLRPQKIDAVRILLALPVASGKALRRSAHSLRRHSLQHLFDLCLKQRGHLHRVFSSVFLHFLLFVYFIISFAV